MEQLTTMITGTTHQLYDLLIGAAGRRGTAAESEERDRGAVSLEQVMWFVAAGAAVAVIATILFTRIRNEANDSDIDRITVPDGLDP